MLETYLNLPLYLIFLWFALRRLMTFLHIFQQEEYDNKRFLHWLLEHRVFDKRVSAGLLGVFVLSFILFGWLSLLLTLGIFAAAAYFEKDPRKSGKKKLNLTDRAKRILGLAFAMVAFIGFFVDSALGWIILVQALALFLPLANKILSPYERKNRQKFYDEAVEKLGVIRPKVIGITGSFGKTSIKHILGHVLKTAAPTIITPGSVNTVMGITRIIREQLEPHHRYFIVEMGAYGPGSIKTLCALTPPDFGIISAIGHAHYERFKTLETVAEAKYELALAAINKGGKAIVQEATLRFPYSASIRDQHADQFVICGDGAANPFSIVNVEQTEKGLNVSMQYAGRDYTLFAPLFGLHHGQNVALVFTAAVTIGMTPEDVITALATTPQIQHRLEVKPQPDGTVIIDDAYNSNPQGFRSGLDLLNLLKKEGRAILVTPGMVEMGAAHEEEHQKIGAYAATMCDVVLVVSPARIPTFISGYKNAGGREIIEVETFAQAQDWLMRNKKSGDVVLLENDLPDLYERVPNL